MTACRVARPVLLPVVLLASTFVGVGVVDSGFAAASTFTLPFLFCLYDFTKMMLRSILSLLVSLAVQAEIREFNGLIEADSTYIHYSEGYIIAPGFIDLSQLSFSTVENADEVRVPPLDDRGGDTEADDDVTVPGSVDTNPNKKRNPNKTGGGGRRLAADTSTPGSAVCFPLLSDHCFVAVCCSIFHSQRHNVRLFFYYLLGGCCVFP
jgi:hypothetical protein